MAKIATLLCQNDVRNILAPVLGTLETFCLTGHLARLTGLIFHSAPPFLVMGGSNTMKILGKTHFGVRGVVMWAWPGPYAPQLPQIRLLAVVISFFNKFLKFFRVVNGHAKTDFWLQQLYWLRPFFDPPCLKNPVFFHFLTSPF